MLGFLWGRASDRKFRLFAVACCRRELHAWWLQGGGFYPQLLDDADVLAALTTAERFADGLDPHDPLLAAADRIWAESALPLFAKMNVLAALPAEGHFFA